MKTKNKSDARLPPKINSLLTQGYTGKAGSCILVQATDNIKVKRVTVSIYDSEKSLVEESEAVENGDGFNWIFTAIVAVESIAGFVIEARAYDIAKNVAVKVAFLD